MKLGVARVIIFAKDMEKMAAFYGGTLGLPRVATRESSADFISFEAGSVQITLHRIAGRSARVSDPPVARKGTPIKVAFRARDVGRVRAELVSRGANLGPVRRSGSLELCDGVDPEGNVFQLSNRA